MKNIEKYIDEIAKVSCVKEVFEDYRYYCSGCEFSTEGDCDCNKVKQWLLAEYVEPIKLTHDEYVILKNIDECYKWLARNPYHNSLRIFIDKPFKKSTAWQNEFMQSGSGVEVFNKLFQFVKFEDEEPYEIAKLIADYEKENGNE